MDNIDLDPLSGHRCNIICSDSDKAVDLIAKYIAKVILSGKICRYYTEKLVADEIGFELKKYGIDLNLKIEDSSLTVEPIMHFFDDAMSKNVDFSNSSIILDMNYMYAGRVFQEDFFYYEDIIKSYFEANKNGGVIVYNIDRAGVDLLSQLINKHKDIYLCRFNNKIYTYDSSKMEDLNGDIGSLIIEFARERENEKKIGDEATYINNLLIELSYKKDEMDIAYSSLESLCSYPYADCGCIVFLENNEKHIVNYNLSQELLELFQTKIDENNMEETKREINEYGYSICNISKAQPKAVDILKKNDIQSSIATAIKKDDIIYGYMLLGSSNNTFMFKGNGEFLNRVAQAIGNVIHSYKEYEKMLDTMVSYRKIQALGELTGGIAHEFNNILTPILGYIQIIKNKTEDKNILNYVQMIENSAIDGARIVRRIQDFTRKEGKAIEVVDIDKAVAQSVEIMKPKWIYEAQINRRLINVTMDLASGGFVEGIETEIREIFVNMISNSVDALKNGGEIKIKTFNKNDRVIITFEDNGEGIDRKHIDRIFEPFFTTKKEKGNGLGLPVIHNIIKNMNGDIQVKSIKGTGTRFTIELPLTRIEDRWGKETADTKNQNKYNILVIDDQPQVAETLCEMLKMMGHNAFCGLNHSEASKLFKENKIDCIICDLAMPDITGIELCKKVKKINSDIPFILMTGWPGKLKDDEISIIDGILQKPFSMEDISNILGCITDAEIEVDE